MKPLKSLQPSLIAVVLSLILVLPAGPAAAQDVTSLPGQFVYVENGTSLVLIRGNVAEPTLLIQAEPGATVSHPRFSDDGRTLAYCLDLAGTGRQPALYTLDTLSFEKVEVAPEGSCDFDWSPDGRTLIYSTPYYIDVPSTIENGIWTYDRETAQSELLIPGAFRDPQWADEDTISYFDFCFECIGQFYTHDLQTGETQEWSQMDTDWYIGPEVDWSPDGSLLAYDRAIWVYSGEGETYPISVASSDGATRKDIYAQPGRGAFFPLWSPDGRRIAFTSFQSFTIGNFVNRSGELTTVAPDGSDPKTLYTSVYEIFPQAWSPDERYLLIAEPQSMPQDAFQEQQLVLLESETGTVLWKTASTGTITADWGPVYIEQAVQAATATLPLPEESALPTTVSGTPAVSSLPTQVEASGSRASQFSFLLWAGALAGIAILMLYLWRLSRIPRAQAPAPEPEPQVELQPAPVPEPAPQPTPVDVDQAFQAGVALVRAGKAEQGMAELSKVIAVQPENEDAWFWLGVASARQSDLRAAERCFLQAKRHGHPEADKALDWLKKQKS